MGVKKANNAPEGKTMNAQESISIENLLKRNSYDCRYEAGVVIVKDPVQSSLSGTEYKDVTIKSFKAAIKFIEDRS